jgi:hypothetical protein
VHFSSECTDWFSKKRRLLHLLCITDGNMLVFSYAIRDCIRKLFDKNLAILIRQSRLNFSWFDTHESEYVSGSEIERDRHSTIQFS